MRFSKVGLGCAIGVVAFCYGEVWSEQALPIIRNGSTVAMHYTLTVDGRVVDSSVGKNPLTYVQGTGQIIPGLEEQMQGMKKGEKKQVTVKPDKGYGPIDPDAFQVVGKKSVPNWKNVKVGAVLTGKKDGHSLQARVVAIDGDSFTLDLNHPLAGKVLQFDIQVVSVKPPMANPAAKK